MEEQKPTLNINKEEADLIKSVFKDNDELLKSMRALFFGQKLSAEEKSVIKSTFANEALYKIVKNRFLPELDRDLPIGQVSDVWYGTESMVFGQTRDTIEQAVQYKDMAIDMTRKAMELLKDPDGEQIDVSYNPDLIIKDPLQIKLLARNQYLRHINDQLMFLKMIASQVDETEEERKERRLKDSAK